MNLHLQRWFLASACVVLLNSVSFAQDKPVINPVGNPAATPEKPPESIAIQNTKRALNHKSSFETYRPYSDEKAANWKAANDEVGRIGGWRTYLKEAQEPDADAGKKPAAPPSSNVSPNSANAPKTIAPAAIPAKPVQPANPHAGHGGK
jgi:hypothetical protein